MYLKVDVVVSYSPPTLQKEVHELITPSLDNYYLCHYLSQGGIHGPEGTGLLFPSFARQSNKAILFYFTQTLSIRFNLAPVYRGAELLPPITGVMKIKSKMSLQDILQCQIDRIYLKYVPLKFLHSFLVF